ncbi:MAG: hypothetical protein UY36_C0017G0002 [Parcubacteria group bacterium GW2011_GWA1_49_11]|nr:MAG: hypothetical protein UY36_C0017G0002 [Parcubacteria group bacterium GW2011_GWA1_49_11]
MIGIARTFGSINIAIAGRRQIKIIPALSGSGVAESYGS